MSLQSLPNELLLEVFKGLDYWDLTRSIPLISKRFNSLIPSKCLDDALFRGPPPPPPGLNFATHYEFHPILNMICYKFALLLHWMGLLPPHEHVLLRATPQSRENATSPAVEVLHVVDGYMNMNITIGVKGSGKALSAVDVLKGIINHFNQVFNEAELENRRLTGMDGVEIVDGELHLFMKGWVYDRQRVESHFDLELRASLMADLTDMMEDPFLSESYSYKS